MSSGGPSSGGFSRRPKFPSSLTLVSNHHSASMLPLHAAADECYLGLDANILQTMLDRTARIDALEDTIRDLQSQLAWHRQGAPAGGEPITSWSASAQMTPAPPAPPLWLLSTPGPSSGASSNPLWTPPSGSSPSFADSFTESSVHNGNIDSMAFQQPPPPSRSLPSANTSTPVLQGGFGFGTVQPYVQHQSQLFGTPTPPPQPPQPWMQWDPSVHPPDGSVALPPAYHMPSSPLPSGLPQTAMPLPDHHQYHATAPGMHAAATQSPGAAFWDQAPAQYANTAQLTQPTFQEFPPAMNVNLAAVPGGSGLSMDGQLQPDAPMLASRNLFDEFVEEHAWETDAEPSVPYQRRRGHEQGHGRHHHRSRGR